METTEETWGCMRAMRELRGRMVSGTVFNRIGYTYSMKVLESEYESVMDPM